MWEGKDNIIKKNPSELRVKPFDNGGLAGVINSNYLFIEKQNNKSNHSESILHYLTLTMSASPIPKHLETAFTPGFSYTSGEYLYSFYTKEIGPLLIKEGLIIACDPFLYNDDPPFTTQFPIGSFPVDLAVAQINDDERVAFARISFSGNKPVSWTMAVIEGQDLSTLTEEQIFGYGVDAGTGAFLDVSGGRELQSYLSADSNNFQVLIDAMEVNYKDTWDWLIWEQGGSNVAMFKSGWGDGAYASYIGYDENGQICRLVTDFCVID